ncbi:hypothetical protein BGX38DRAFT_1275462 [Terfezia claveryi]|nr:hypothetical protein BGX38DRAFT_1275462 [Terfezia claveryi]
MDTAYYRCYQSQKNVDELTPKFDNVNREKNSDSINKNSIIKIKIKIKNNQENNIIINNLKEREKNNPSLEKNNLLLEEEKIP